MLKLIRQFQTTPSPAQISLIHWGRSPWLRIRSADGLDLMIGAENLHTILSNILTSLPASGLIRGELHDETGPAAKRPSPAPDTGRWRRPIQLADIPTDPERGWPFLYQHCPSLFAGINLESEPYYPYIKASHTTTTDELQTHLAELKQLNPETIQHKNGSWNLSAIARTLGLPVGGSRWAYIKKLASHLSSSSTESSAASDQPSGPAAYRKAA